MLFVANNYDVQFNAKGMNNMEQFRCHYRPLPVCGTIKVKTNKNNTITATTTTAAEFITTKQLQKQQPQVKVQHDDFESLQVLNEAIVNEVDHTYPNNVRNDISSSSPNSICWFKKHKRQQRHLRVLRSSLLKINLRRQRLDPFKNYSRLNWHHILLDI